MKHLFFTIAIVLLGLSMFAQEVQFPPSVLAGGGNNSQDEGTYSIRWRLSQIHVITITDDMTTNVALMQEGSFLLYPNPVEEFLNIKFQTTESNDYIIKLTDVLGRILDIQDQKTILPEEVIKLNLSTFPSATYFLSIESSDHKIRTVFPIQKI